MHILRMYVYTHMYVWYIRCIFSVYVGNAYTSFAAGEVSTLNALWGHQLIPMPIWYGITHIDILYVILSGDSYTVFLLTSGKTPRKRTVMIWPRIRFSIATNVGIFLVLWIECWWVLWRKVGIYLAWIHVSEVRCYNTLIALLYTLLYTFPS